ncbi:MAG: DUF2018 family protein [Sulfurimonas sp.]|jgi:hypothetical protein|uniref:DUF2018 family protein n=1 Tax=Sulfurimonas sp. TaxID=2022749 RepID=UPI0026050F13|nr:DUF2018 family protein [Sulfurimonas sp.]MDD3475962.1 DUF2018 family protein [Sulfurimonas sp.]HUH42854.1 DUF2018 family protein [Sulfurimonas sp.]
MYGLFEDEDDIFMGSPKSKLMDVLFNANNDVVRYELEKFIDRAAAMEMMMREKCSDIFNDDGDKIEKDIKSYILLNRDEVDNFSKNLYIEMMGAILSQSE